MKKIKLDRKQGKIYSDLRQKYTTLTRDNSINVLEEYQLPNMLPSGRVNKNKAEYVSSYDHRAPSGLMMNNNRLYKNA